MKPEQDPQKPQLVPESEAAELLGVSTYTLKNARLHRLQTNALRDLPYVKIGRCVRYSIDDIRSWIIKHTVGGA